MIQAHQPTKRYGDKTAVHTLRFTIAPGTVTGFLGPNVAQASPTGSTVPRCGRSAPRSTPKPCTPAAVRRESGQRCG